MGRLRTLGFKVEDFVAIAGDEQNLKISPQAQEALRQIRAANGRHDHIGH
jgi:hypothetical protein